MLWRNHNGEKNNKGSRNIINLQFAHDIDAPSEGEQELESLLEILDKTCAGSGTEISAEKTKLMANNVSGIQRKVKVK